jgi:hypothetical protein
MHPEREAKRAACAVREGLLKPIHKTYKMSDDIIQNQRKNIITLLKEKAVMKQDVYKNTLATFDLLKTVIQEISADLKEQVQDMDKRIGIDGNYANSYSAQIKVAGDILEFFMHTNVFEFDRSHPMYKTGYIRRNESNSYCGIINVYNFLADSFKYNRTNDLGYLICRVFINREMRFFVETKTQMGYKYNSFSSEPITKEQITEIVQDLILHAINFDLFTPPFDAVKEVSVTEMQERMSSMNLRIGKRLGYGVSASTEDTNLYI